MDTNKIRKIILEELKKALEEDIGDDWTEEEIHDYETLRDFPSSRELMKGKTNEKDRYEGWYKKYQNPNEPFTGQNPFFKSDDSSSIAKALGGFKEAANRLRRCEKISEQEMISPYSSLKLFCMSTLARVAKQKLDPYYCFHFPRTCRVAVHQGVITSQQAIEAGGDKSISVPFTPAKPK